MALPNEISTAAAVIAAGQSLSAGVPLGAMTLVGVSMPGTWTTANLTFQASLDGGTTWQDIYTDAGAELTVDVAASQFIAFSSFPDYVWRGVNMLKVRSGTTAAPVTQSAGATVTLIIRPEVA